VYIAPGAWRRGNPGSAPLGTYLEREDRVIGFNEACCIENLLIANHAEVANDLLYISGGGGDICSRIIADDGVRDPSFAIALTVRVPWLETNRQHTVVLSIEADNGQTVEPGCEISFTMGRGPDLQPGAIQHFQTALRMEHVHFPAASGYRLVAELDDNADVRSWPFRVVDVEEQIESAPPLRRQ
jgi:hypothetical protein